MPTANVRLEKTLHFASQIVKLYQCLQKERRENVISKRMFHSSTPTGANANEAILGYTACALSAEV